MENMDDFEFDLSGPSALRRQALQARLAADGGWFGLFNKMRTGDVVEVTMIRDEYLTLASGVTSDAERVANAEDNQRHKAATSEASEATIDRNFMQLAAGGINADDISALQFSIGMCLMAHPGQPIQFSEQ